MNVDLTQVRSWCDKKPDTWTLFKKRGGHLAIYHSPAPLFGGDDIELVIDGIVTNDYVNEAKQHVHNLLAYINYLEAIPEIKHILEQEMNQVTRESELPEGLAGVRLPETSFVMAAKAQAEA